MSRHICVELYDEIIKLRPDWHNDDVNKGKIKDNNDELKIVIVRDMWLIGFDVPPMHTSVAVFYYVRET